MLKKIKSPVDLPFSQEVKFGNFRVSEKPEIRQVQDFWNSPQFSNLYPDFQTF